MLKEEEECIQLKETGGLKREEWVEVNEKEFREGRIKMVG